MAKKKPYWGDTGDPSAVTADSEGETGQILGYLGGGVEGAAHDVGSVGGRLNPIGGAVGDIESLFGGGGGDSTKEPAKGGPTLSGEEAQVKKLQGELKTETGKKTAEDQYQQLADAQANQYLQMTKALDPLTSGAALPAIEGTAAQNASQMLGASSTSPVSQWLNAQTGAAQAQNAPAAASNAQVGLAQDYASTLLAGGLENMGQAESKMMQAAPYQQLLSTLAADVPYKLLGGESLQQILPTVQTSEQSLGLSTTSSPTAPAPQLPQINAGIVPPAPVSYTPGAPGTTG